MSRILGIDPGSRATGFGVVDSGPGGPTYRASGCVRTDQAAAAPERLRIIYEAVSRLVAEHRPDAVAVEQVFVHRNPDSALKLGQARGAAICAAVMAGLPVSEYPPATVKQAVVGTGRATKEQVQHMVCALLKLPARPQADAADALAVALCHAHSANLVARYGPLAPARRRRRR